MLGNSGARPGFPGRDNPGEAHPGTGWAGQAPHLQAPVKGCPGERREVPKEQSATAPHPRGNGAIAQQAD
jgi:hypothetical protein